VVKAQRSHGYLVRFPANLFFQKKYLVPPKRAGLGLIRVDWRLSNIYIYEDFYKELSRLEVC